MARIRSIKPDFWNDEKLGQEPEQIMLTFVGLWNFSDDYGVVRANPIWLKNQIYPYKDKLRIDVFSSWLKRLEELEAVIPIIYRGECFYCIRTFRKHQKVDKPSKARNCPEEYLISELKSKGLVINGFGEFVRPSDTTPGVIHESSEKEEEGIGNGIGEGRVEPPPVGFGASVSKSIIDIKKDCLQDKTYFVDHVRKRFTISELQVEKALEAFNEHLLSIGEGVKGVKDYRAHFQNWLAKQDLKQFRIGQKGGTGINETLKRLGL